MKTKLFIVILIATASVTQGAILDIYADDTIQNGDVYDTVNIYDSLDVPPVQTTVDMTGGEIAECHIYDTAILNYWDGEIVYFVIHDNSTAEVHSDYDYSFALEDEGKIFLHNGGSNGQVLIVSPDSQLHIYGYDFIQIPSGSASIIEGDWEDTNQNFSLTVRIAGEINPQDVIFLHTIPEPTTFLLFTFGSLLLRRHYKHLNPKSQTTLPFSRR